MGITRAQIARQLLAEGGVSLNDAQMMAPDGEFLAYINPKEAGILKAMGGSGRMTNMGIPSFTEDDEDQAAMNAPDYSSLDNEEQQAVDRGDRGAIMSTTSRDLQGYGPRTDINDLYGGSGGNDSQTFIDRVISTIKRYSPTGIITRGLGNLFNKLGTLRGFNPDGTPRTQLQFEQARRERQRQSRIANIMGRSAPFTAMTLENLAKLGYTGPLDDSLIGSTNITRSGTPDDDVYSQGIKASNTAKNFIDLDKSISSEDFRPIEERLKDATGYNTTLAKNYTKQDIENLGAEKGFFGANDQLKALQEYYDAVQKLSGPGSKFAPNNPAKARDFITKQSNIPFGAGSYNIDMGLIPQDFLETQEDLQQQKSPIELLDI